MMMGKIDEKKQRKEQSLLDTAFCLFTSQGVSKTSISDIVEKAGVAKGTFYLYFQDKYDLRDRLVVYKARQLFEHALAYSGYQTRQTCADKIIAIVDDVLEQMRRTPVLLRFINKNLSWGIFSRAINQANSTCFQAVREILDADQDTWQEPEIMLYTIIELVSASSHNVILEGNPTDLEHFKPYLFRSIRAIVESFRVGG